MFIFAHWWKAVSQNFIRFRWEWWEPEAALQTWILYRVNFSCFQFTLKDSKYNVSWLDSTWSIDKPICCTSLFFTVHVQKHAKNPRSKEFNHLTMAPRGVSSREVSLRVDHFRWDVLNVFLQTPSLLGYRAIWWNVDQTVFITYNKKSKGCRKTHSYIVIILHVKHSQCSGSTNRQTSTFLMTQS